MPKACALSSLNNYLYVLLHKVTVLFPPRHAFMCKKLHTATICFNNLLRVNSPKHIFSLGRWGEKYACYRVVNSVCATHVCAH